MEIPKLGQEKEVQSLEKRGYIRGRLLGQGAFSRVYRVEERATGRRAACKISENLKLIEREAEILKKLRHPLFPEYYGSWREGKTGFLLIEEITGENMADIIRQGRKFSVYQVAEMGMELAEGLLYLHESRPAIIFRDVKPENIMLRGNGRVKLLDFGCSCEPAADGGTRAGSPGFAAPEQLMEGGGQTLLCDVYGFGRTLQELLWAGVCRGGTAQLSGGQGDQRFRKEIWRCRNERKQREGFWEHRDRKRLEKLLAACVEREPSARPADMRVVLAALFHICPPAFEGGHGKRHGGGNAYRNNNWIRVWHGRRCSDFWQKGITCEKNIRKSSWKSS